MGDLFIFVFQNYGERYVFLGTRLLKSEEDISYLVSDSTDFFQSNIAETYGIRPQTEAFFGLKNFCFVEFAAWDTPQTADENDYQPNQLNEKLHWQFVSIAAKDPISG